MLRNIIGKIINFLKKIFGKIIRKREIVSSKIVIKKIIRDCTEYVTIKNGDFSVFLRRRISAPIGGDVPRRYEEITETQYLNAIRG